MSLTSSARYLPIEDYAVIGDLHTVALVGKNGSIDWCCLPRFDAPSVFGALLDAPKGGFFCIAPSQDADVNRKQIYLPETNILLTTFLTEDGVGEITDFMPIKRTGSAEHQHQIVRSVSVLRGSLSFEITCRPAFNYARATHTVVRSDNGVLFHGSRLHIGLASPLPLEEDGQGGVHATFVLHAGETRHFLLESVGADESVPHPLAEEAYQSLFDATFHYWHTWLAQCTYHGRWREMVQRSALVLKLLTYAPTGAIVAAPTTSLPEAIGAGRNWDYRYTWLRDASFTLYSLLSLGFTGEAQAFMQWLDARCHELNADGSLQPMYGIRGEHELSEETLGHLEGYRQSSPVRIGNGAYTQKQLDIYGMVMDAVFIYNRYSTISYDLWQNLENLLDWLMQHWQETDEGIWEVRGGAKPFVNSRLMSWVAFDRGVRIARQRGLPAPIEKWMETSTQIYREIMKKGWSEEKQHFVQCYGSDAVDASSLLMVTTKFTGSTEPRMLSTIRAIQKELTYGALVHRYNPQKAASDGTDSTHEGTFGACSFWMAQALAESGQVDEGRLMLEKMLSYSNHVGLYAEEIGSKGEALGNFPQAFTHLALITTCYNIDKILDGSGKSPL
ncbi:MAG: glycoside hydrolase family 15 protein [Ktedonobacteraceae bacterium]